MNHTVCINDKKSISTHQNCLLYLFGVLPDLVQSKKQVWYEDWIHKPKNKTVEDKCNQKVRITS